MQNSDTWFKVHVQALVFLVCFGLGLCVGFSNCGCAPAHGPAQASAAQLASVVTLVKPTIEDRWSSLSEEPGYNQAIVWRGYCNAFAIKRANGELVLVTAEHCVHANALGSVLRYLPPDGWGMGEATVLFKSQTGDTAVLSVPGNHGLVPLSAGPAPEHGAIAVSVSSYFGQVSSGSVIGELTPGWYDTSQRVERGWSGSPALTDGRVWGVVAKCRADADGKCSSLGAVIASLPAGAL